MHHVRRSSVLAALTAVPVVLLLALTGCSSSSSGGKTSSDSSSPPSSSGDATQTATHSSNSSSSSPDPARLKSLTVQASDLPGTWKPTAYQADPNDAKNQAALLACAGAKNTAPDVTGTAHSPDYNLADASISSQASTYRAQSDIDADRALLSNAKIDGCYEKLLRSELSKSFPAGTTIKSLTVKIAPGSGGGPDNVVGSGAATVKVAANGQSVTVYVNLAFITGPLTEVEVDFENVGAPVPAATRAAVIKAVAGRAKG